MISADLKAKIRRLYHAEGWPVGTIGRHLGLHHNTVRQSLLHDGVPLAALATRRSKADPYVPFVLETLEKYPRLTASRHAGATRRPAVRDTTARRTTSRGPTTSSPWS